MTHTCCGVVSNGCCDVSAPHIPYKGSTPAVTDLVAGQVQVMFEVTPTSLPQIKVPLAASTRSKRPRHLSFPKLGRAVERSGTIVTTPILSSLRHRYARI